MKRLHFTILFILFLFAPHVHAENIISGKVVGVSDGDTITVLQDRTQYKIRLYGIDTPEKSQDFGTRAKQFTSDMVFGKDVRVVQKDMDGYGRVVGLVYVGETCVNEEIIKNGFAWVYKTYCKDKICREWLKSEDQARNSKIGLWSHPNPVPPWEYRHPNKASSDKIDRKTDSAGIVFHGNTRSKVFHRRGCDDFNCKNCAVILRSREDAIEAGYRPCGKCKP